MYVLLVFFSTVFAGGQGTSGPAGPAAVSIPGYHNKAACTAAGNSLKNQITDVQLKAKTWVFCVPGPS